jgi:hypothetical protein
MSFNRRGGDRRPDRPFDRPPRRSGGGPGGGGDWQRDRPRGDRPYQQRGPRFDRGADEGGMSIRLDPRRLGTLKQLAAEAGVRPGDLVREWVEERIDASRGGARPAAGGTDRILGQMAAIEARLAALEAAAGTTAGSQAPADAAAEPAEPAESTPEASAAEPEAPEPAPEAPAPTRVSASPSVGHVGLHDEMIAVLRDRGPMTAAELAAAIAERGRYAPPRSTKPLDAAMVSQRVSNPTYRKLFTRTDGRIGLAE